eukprot:441348-Alexandrium_andersonii.AAC.1
MLVLWRNGMWCCDSACAAQLWRPRYLWDCVFWGVNAEVRSLPLQSCFRADVFKQRLPFRGLVA